MEQPLITVVVPVYNEEDNLHNFYERMKGAVEGQPFNLELIFVNDGSRDRSWSILQELAGKDDRIVAINLSRNFGSYAAINCGWAHAKGAAVMCISADLQDPPEIIRDFFPHWKAGNHIVWGTREGRQDPFMKSLLARLFYWVLRKAALPDFPKDGMDMGLFDRSVVERYLDLKEKHGIPFVTIYTMGFKQVRVPYLRRARVAGESNWPLGKRIKFAMDVLADHSYMPIRAMTLGGIFVAFASMAYGVLLVILKLFFGIGSDGWTSLATLIVFIGGIQMLFLGIIAEYLWRTCNDVKRRPPYYVMDVVSSKK